MCDDEFYSLLNLSKQCTEDQIKASYRRLCVIYHPDKHRDADRESAEQMFQKIKRAYNVLIDQHLRTIYDIYGVQGLDSDMHLALQDLDRNQIKEAYERLLERRKWQEQEAATNPVSSISLQVDASGLVHSNRDTYFTELIGMPVDSFTISQSVDAPLSENTKATILCASVNNDSLSTGLMTTNLRYSFPGNNWLETGFSFGHGASVALRGYTTLTKYLFASFRSGATLIDQKYLQYEGTGTLGCNLSSAQIKAELSLNRTVKGIISKSWERLQLYISYKFGLDNQIISMYLLHPLSMHPQDGANLECTATYDLQEGAYFQYGAAKKLTEYSELAALVRISQYSGVKLKLVLSRGRHSYRFDIIFSDVLEPAAVLYGTFLPVFVYSALWLLIKPYLNRLKAEEVSQKSEDLEAKLETDRKEAREAIHLMRSAYERNVNSEQCKRGLLIVQAWYGVFGNSTTNKLIDVTIPLQCLVSSSRLMLEDPSKTGLAGFYDVSYGEDKKLAVKYKFRNVMHEVVISDAEPLRIPKQSHKMSGS